MMKSLAPYILLILLAGLLIHGPTVTYPGFLQTSTHDGYISTGDHGRDFYAFWQTANGRRPYRDYSWVYGPLMPYYYGLMISLLGNTIPTILTAKMLLHVASGLFFLLLMARILPAATASVAALWYLVFNPHFYHTNNHAGGILLIFAILYCLFSWIQTNRRAYFLAGWGLLSLLMLVKLNIGLAMTLVYTLPFISVKEYRDRLGPCGAFRLFASAAGVMLITILSYMWSLRGLPNDALFQLLPILNKGHTGLQSPAANIKLFLELYSGYFLSGKVQTLLAVLVLVTGMQTVYRLVKRNDPEKGKTRRRVLVILACAYAALSHEYVMTGTFYRIFWTAPLTILFMFIFIELGTEHIQKFLRIAVYGALLSILTLQVADRFHKFQRISSGGEHYWSHPKARIHVANDAAWINTVEDTAAFLDQHAQAPETFLALPYDPLYYYLAEQRAPVSRLIFYDFDAPGPEEELKLIRTLEDDRVNWIVLSNTGARLDENFGTFGETHCVQLAQYIESHFEPAADFGNFEAQGSWTDQYAVRIFTRERSQD